MKPLSNYLETLSLLERQGKEDPEIENIAFDSRQAGRGVLFVAQKGSRVDGHDFIDQAIAAGCPAIVCEKIPAQCQPGVVYLQVADSSRRWDSWLLCILGILPGSSSWWASQVPMGKQPWLRCCTAWLWSWAGRPVCVQR